MSGAWKEWEGQTVQGEFPLLKYMGGSSHSAVFLTERAAQEPRKAAIKLVRADPQNAELELSRWGRASNLSHPNLIRIFQTGRCQLGGEDLLYILMEYADESLSTILPQRPLTPEEVREMLPLILDGLVCVHRHGFVHGRLKPANILATGDQLKLSSDGLCRMGEPRGGREKHTAYDPPEGASGRSTPAGDIWSLGITLVEALTQHLPVSAGTGYAGPVLPETLPAPFLDIVRGCLRRDPQRRFTVADIAVRLKPAQAVPPRQVPPQAAPRRASAKPRLLVPAIVVGLALLAFVAVPWLLNRPSHPQSDPAVANKQSSPAAPVKSNVQSPSKSKPQPQVQTKPASQPEQKAAARKSGEPAPVAASPRTRPETKPRSSGRAQGEVLKKVLPVVAQKSLDTIHGTVRVSVRVQVDPSGEVVGAEFDSPGPSKYFAEQALNAARRWKFDSPLLDGHYVRSEWLLRFHFTPSGVKVIPTQSAP
jgi:TonB family protein